MAKKTFKNNLGGREYLNVINTGKGKKEEKKEPKAEKQAPEPVKEKLEKPEKTKYQPHTLKIRTDVWEATQALAWWERTSFQDFFTHVLESHVASLDPKELKGIIEKYKKHKKK